MPEQFFTGFTCATCGLATVGVESEHTREQCLDRQLSFALARVSELEAMVNSGAWLAARAAADAQTERPLIIRD
jgi:hypothetical protein